MVTAQSQTARLRDITPNHGQRYYVSDVIGTSKYTLPADEAERERLNTQSQLLNQTFDDKLIWAPIDLKNGDTILDSGTGSGHWLLSVAKQIPTNIHLHGIDIEPRMFPPNPPLNTIFTTKSITNLPPSWTSSISLIHQRLLVAALQEHQWKAALREMHRVLVPGGWVQLVEPKHILDTPSDALRNHTAFQIRDKMVFDIRNIKMDIVYHLPAWLQETGFINLQVGYRRLPLGSWAGEYGSAAAKVTFGYFSATKGPIMKEGGFGMVDSEEGYDALVEDMMRLCEETPETYVDYRVYVAQKPLA